MTNDPFGFNKAINYDKLNDPKVLKELKNSNQLTRLEVQTWSLNMQCFVVTVRLFLANILLAVTIICWTTMRGDRGKPTDRFSGPANKSAKLQAASNA